MADYKERLADYEKRLRELYRDANETYDDIIDTMNAAHSNERRLQTVNGKGKLLGISGLFNDRLNKKSQQKQRIIKKLTGKINGLEKYHDQLHRSWDSDVSKISSLRSNYLNDSRKYGGLEGESEAELFLKILGKQVPIYGKKVRTIRSGRNLAIIGFVSLFLSLFSFSRFTGSVIGVTNGNIFGIIFILLFIVLFFIAILLNKRKF